MSHHLLRLLSLLCLLLVIPGIAGAATFLSDEEGVSQNESIDDDVFVASNTVRLNQLITGDVFSAGDVVEVVGDVEQDVFAAGQAVTISGNVGDDILAAGRSVIITSSAVDDILAAGNSVSVSADTTIRGSAYIAGTSIEVGGTYQNSVYLHSDQIVIRPGTIIEGDLKTYGAQEPVIPDSVTIRGKHEHTKQAGTEVMERSTRDTIMSWLRSVITWFIAALLLLLLLPSLTRQAVTLGQQRPAKAIGMAVLWFLLLIPVAIVLSITIVGIPVMIVFVLLSLAAFLLGFIYANIFLGALIMKRFMPSETKLTWQHVLLGTVVLKTLPLIPVVGGLIVFAITLWAIGALWLTLWQLLRHDTTVPA